MRGILDIFLQIILALTGAVAAALASVVGVALALAGVGFGISLLWRGWRRRRQD